MRVLTQGTTISGLLGLALTLSACGLSIFTDPKTHPVLEDHVGEYFQRQPIGTLATTAERRIVLVRLDGGEYAHFCAEPPPDAAENIAAQLALAVEASAKARAAEGVGKVELGKQLATTVQSLFRRSQGIQFYRDAMYNLCQARLNGFLDNTQWLSEKQKLREIAQALIEKELDRTNGVIGGPPPTTTTIVLSDGTTVAPTQPLKIPAERIRTIQLIEKLKSAKGQEKKDDMGVIVVELYDILVTRNALPEEDVKTVLPELRSLAKDQASREKLVIPSTLATFKDKPDAFRALFL